MAIRTHILQHHVGCHRTVSTHLLRDDLVYDGRPGTQNVSDGLHEVVEDQEGEPVENFLVILDQG